MKKEFTYSNLQLTILVIGRILIGWYCLYEGIAKLMNPRWSSFAFLNDSQGWMADVFQSMAKNPDIVSVIDFLNIWGLIAIGLGLIIGLFSRFASVSGIILISMYYLSHPPLVGVKYLLTAPESTMWVDKNLIFILLLFILLVFPTSQKIGIDRLLIKRK